MKRALLGGLLLACALAPSCTTPRTEIVVRIETDMTQGPTATLSAIAVRVISSDETTPRYDQRTELGVGTAATLLPVTLGVVPRDASASRRIEVQVDALHGDTVLFTRRAIATFAQGRTLLLQVFLADRCSRPENQVCPDGYTCGPTGCEPVEHMMLPDFGDDAGAADASMDAGLDAGGDAGGDVGVAHDAGHDTGMGTDAFATADTGSDAFAFADAGCPAGECGGACVDLTSDPSHCGTCGNACSALANGTSSCRSGGCDIACSAGYVEQSGACIALAAPRPLAPLSLGRLSVRSPTFRWDLPPGADGAHVDVCSDPACATIEGSFDAVGTSGRLATALATSITAVHYFRLFARTGTVTSPTASATWAFAIPFADAATETARPLLFDADLDGHGDIAVADPARQAVYLFAGGATGPPTVPTMQRTGSAGSGFGTSVAHAGDVDGDGHGDLIVGAPGEDAAYVYLGSATGLASTATRIAGVLGTSFGASVASAGDVDGDGYGDVVIGAPGGDAAYVFRGSSAGVRSHYDLALSGTSGTHYGAAVASAGDVDGDGYDDVIVGAPGGDAAFFYRGSSAGVVASSRVALAGTAGSGFGSALAAGDSVTLDGFTDLAVGAPTTATVLVFAGAASGLDPTADFTIVGGAEHGRSIACADLDLNGFEDVVVGTAAEIVDVYLSNPSGPGARAGWNQTISPPAGAMGFGRVVATSEVSNSRYHDVVVGAPLSNDAFFCPGRSSGALTADVTLTSGGASTQFGASVASLALPGTCG